MSGSRIKNLKGMIFKDEVVTCPECLSTLRFNGGFPAVFHKPACSHYGTVNNPTHVELIPEEDDGKE